MQVPNIFEDNQSEKNQNNVKLIQKMKQNLKKLKCSENNYFVQSVLI